MVQFDILTIFPKIFNSYLNESLIKKAQEKKKIKIEIHNLRKWAEDKHRTVDSRPFGGGLGMVLMVEPIYKAISDLTKSKTKNKKRKIILFTPRGKQFNQKIAYNLSKFDQIIMICGRYEGVDERVAKKISDLELSVGPYDLMGGEIPAMIVIETISRLIPGVIGKEQFLKEKNIKGKGFVEYVQYTRPEIFSPKKGINWKVPKVLLSGHHKKIQEWKEKNGKVI
ncbi:tRNA (guanosine(37)-N1)-methyltransferase TrmD [Patescibacteria group bacterium]|nr:tRNA (guanosine(37)-N1)-methyltransferase TrmD [Patescibacteria group bacterium]MBU1876892.1 tRNA (guanosine(37)-N1)-methyltransferase TrmD [Patescibacteria group bacterium]